MLNKREMPEIKAYFGLNKINHPAIQSRFSNKRMGKPKPSKDTSHHFRGSRSGARQDKKNRMTSMILEMMKKRLVKMRKRVAIAAIYRFK
jgi:hypothetical protein